MTRRALDELKRQVPLLEYLQTHDWQQALPIGFGRLLGLCPLHADHKPSFLVDARKKLFHCYGCRRGGDIIRFVELYHQVKFPEAVALLHQWRGLPPLLHEAAGFYRMQLHRHTEAVAYLCQRGICSPEVIEHMRIGWPTQLCEPTRTRCCTFSGGGRVFTTPMRSPKMLSPNRHCSTMCDSSPARNAS